MEVRKLQKTGGSTFTLSLPKRWVVASGLRAGDAVFVEVLADGSLALRPRPAAPTAARKRSLEVREGEPRDHLLRKLIGSYISGDTSIEIRFKPESGPAVRRVARDFARMVIGPEILEEGRTSIVLQDLSDPAELSGDKGLRRMYMTVRAMHEDALEAVRTGDAALAKDVEQRDEDVDRLYWMIAKQYTLAHLAGPAAGIDWVTSGIHNHRLVAKLLERIGDHAERIASAVPATGGRLEPKLMKDLSAASETALGLLDAAFSSLMSGDVEAANEAVDRVASLQKLTEALAHRVATHKGQDLLALGSIVDSLGRTGGYAADIAEIAINQSFGREG